MRDLDTRAAMELKMFCLSAADAGGISPSARSSVARLHSGGSSCKACGRNCGHPAATTAPTRAGRRLAPTDFIFTRAVVGGFTSDRQLVPAAGSAFVSTGDGVPEGFGRRP